MPLGARLRAHHGGGHRSASPTRWIHGKAPLPDGGPHYRLPAERSPREAKGLQPQPTTPSPPPRTITVKVEGTVTSTYSELPGELWVDDTRILVTNETDIEGTPSVGRRVVVIAFLEEERLIARRIRVLQEELFEFRGVIDELPEDPYEGSWTVSGIEVQVDRRATVFNSPNVGYYAQVKGHLIADRRVSAVEVRVLDPAETANSFEFEGPIQEINPINHEGAIWVIGGMEGRVDENSEIEGTPEPGKLAEVSGHISPDGSLYFEHIRVLEEGERLIRFEGLIYEIDTENETWTVGETIFIVDELTFVDESRARAIPGMWAEVMARPRGRYYHAVRIRVERPE